MKPRQYLSTATAIALLAALTGCGGGSSSTPTITARPKTVESGGAAVAANGKKGNGGGNVVAGGKGSFKGTIVYDGAPPSLGKPSGYNPGDPKTDKFCVRNDQQIKDDSLVVDSATKGLKNVVVYLARKPQGYRATVPKKPLRFTNKNCMFEPHVLAMVAGRPMTIANDDETSHNTHTFPLNSAVNTGFNQTVAPNKTATYAYGGAEKQPVKVTCDIHGWMIAYHLPLDHEFFAVTNEKGEFEIKDLPAGTHKFNIWHERGPGQSRLLQRELTVTIKGGATEQQTLKFGPGKFASNQPWNAKTIVLSFTK